MASGRQLQLAKQTGEYLVASELCRRGLIATTFTGNVPHYDIIASDETGGHVPIQVKALRTGAWQLDIRKFAELEFKDGKQHVGKPIKLKFPNLICVFLQLSDYGKDSFFIMEWKDLQTKVIRDYKRNLKKHGGARPRKPDSGHCIVAPSSIERFRDNWSLIEKALGVQ